MIHDKQSAQISQKQDERNIYVIMKTMRPPGYHHNGFVALRHMMYGIYIYIHIYICIYICIYNFDVTLASYDGAEVCELSGILMLSLTGNKYNPNIIGLYRDEGLAIFKNTSGRNLNKLKRFSKKCLRRKVYILS